MKLSALPWRTPVVIIALFWGISGNAEAVPRVVATIKPIHSLVAGVMAGVGQPGLLIEGAGSPHDYALRPSGARMLAHADLVIRVGTDFETFLNRVLANLSGGSKILDLDQIPGMVLLATREGGLWQETHSGENQPDHGHGHGENNLHLWLDPQNARTIVAGTAGMLAKLDPTNAARYRANAAALDRRLVSLDQELKTLLAPVSQVPYIVFHDAYPYLEHRYGLHPAGAIVVSPERPPGARRIAEIRQTVEQQGARCVFSEPQFQPRLATLLIEGTGARHGVLDPLGGDLPAGTEAYFSLMRNLAKSLRQCLQAEP